MAEQINTGTEHLHPSQFKNQQTGYVGKRRGQPSPGAGAPPGKHRATGKHEAPYSAGKDIGGAVGSTKKPEYAGKHSRAAEGKHGKAYNFDADAATSIGKGKGPDYVGRHRPKPQGEGKHGKPYDADKDIAQSMKGHKKDYVGKHSARYKPEKKKLELKGNIRFKPSRHAGKNKEHLKALVK